jgi:pimeloyl-ACP methyl ester carboxylesterase
VKRALAIIFIICVSAQAFSTNVKAPKPKNLIALAYKNPKVEKSILFIHGTPGSREAFSYYINDKSLRKKASMISVDRIGFGKIHTKAETSFEGHNISIFKTATNIFGNKKIICVGHSYGATLCLDLIARYPEHFEKAILIAGGANPHRKILRWYNYIAASWPVRALLSKSLMNSNKEMYGLKKELLKLEQKFKKIQASVVIIHGYKDKIVPYKDSTWLLKKLKENNVSASLKTYKSDGHFIIWKQEEKIKDDILKEL